MSPAVTIPGVRTEFVYRKPPPTPEFLDTPINLYSDADNYRDKREVFVRDIRPDMFQFKTENDGLEFLKHEVDIKDWSNEDEIREVMLRETEELLKRHFNSKRVFTTVQRIRHSDSSGVRKDTTPVYSIHADLTVRSGLELLENTAANMEPLPKSLPPKGRVLLVNVWRPLKAIKRDPIAFLVPRSIKLEERHAQIFSQPEGKFKVFGRDAQDFWLDTASYSKDQDWVFLDHQQPDEPVLFLQWDSAGLEKFESKMAVFHSSFEDSRYINDTERASIEMKCLVFLNE
ncbi:hypothetical protein BDP81DRAFT_399116 [Colletotrichum phormii]|uniref:Gibberellin cluster GA4 desaturase n=1 Tax=Colletotrichum phormii TaxID=359342 RepID=A0AAI9ZFT5_9PEZI|nr:uncharacterized protein BDP81DRAFT_399116 [Colletotrichum phormii]KAK1623764.1 hypothetical protein BDP81DRAFT_399116 [Colletotrichum phormii]